MNRENVTDLRTKITVLRAKNWILSSITILSTGWARNLKAKKNKTI